MAKNLKNMITCVAMSCVAVGLLGCGGDEEGARETRSVISNSGSDTMVNLAQAWAEAYGAVAPDVDEANVVGLGDRTSWHIGQTECNPVLIEQFVDRVAQPIDIPEFDGCFPSCSVGGGLEVGQEGVQSADVLVR